MDVEAFIRRWSNLEGGAERANYAMFLTELCAVLEVEPPNPAGGDRAANDYVFERAVKPRLSEASTTPKRIDLYKKNAFILEAKQSRLPEKKNAIAGQTSLFEEATEAPARRTAVRGWDVMMQNARKQAEGYVFLLDADHPAPPFIVTCDVGHCLELYADFTGTGRAYDQFPDRKGFRIFLDDLRRPDIRELLVKVWTDPHSLDPTKESTRVTREIAKRLAEVSKALEAKNNDPEHVAHFLMRCLFTMFAEDTGLLPSESFRKLLENSVRDPRLFTRGLKTLWSEMESGTEFSLVIQDRVRHFNGGLFKDTTVFELGPEEIGELLAAARANWTQVDPAIFGTLLEQALDKTERARLGAHYTPRAYVQRLVDATVMEPLRADWQAALTRAEDAKEAGRDADAIAQVRAFHHQLCTTRILDPACGTGNFLYVALELMKKLEGEVLQTLSDLGDRQASLALPGETVDPHLFLGLELNPRAAAIAELVVWIGYLQWHYRNHESHPAEPILRAFSNINFGKREGYDAVLTWDGYPVPGVVEKDGKRVETYPNPRRPDWPVAEFIVGNPPFIGNKRMRELLGSPYIEALRLADKGFERSADFVLHWWARAAELLILPRSKLRRFGFVTTNSITQSFNRRVIEKYLATSRLVLRMAIPNHPWTKGDRSSAAVRIAMTVADRTALAGILYKVISEADLDTDQPDIRFSVKTGVIAANLEVGPDTNSAAVLLANEDLAHQGVIPVGEGFRLERKELEAIGYTTKQLPSAIRRYVIGRDLAQRAEERFIIDLYGLTASEARTKFPNLFQIVLERVKPQRDIVNRAKTRENYWIYAEPRRRMREALHGQERYIATCRTAKHRIFSFLASDMLPDTKVIAIALEDASLLAVLSSRLHVVWATQTGGWLGVGDDASYNHSDCFAKFPFPVVENSLNSQLHALGEELDATRKLVLDEHPDLTLTGLYNLLEKVKAGAALTPAEEDARQRGRVLILKELHEQIDAATAQAYGWPADLADEQILERLVALNAERAKEEAAGQVRWLRPDYQIPRFAKGAGAKTGELDLGETVVALDKGLPPWPADRYEQPLAIEALLTAAARPMDAAELSRAFKKGGKRIEQRVHQALTNLARYGRVTALPDGRYAARRAA